MKTCTNCYSENSVSNTTCFQCGESLLTGVTASKNKPDSSSDSTTDAKVSSRSSSKTKATVSQYEGVGEAGLQELMNAIERNTQATEKSLAATRAIAVFMLGWVGWFIAGVAAILLGLLVALNSDTAWFGGLLGFAGAIVILVGVIKAISDSLKELAKSK